MRIVNLAHPRSQTPPARRSEDPPQANYSSMRVYEAGRTAVVEPIAPQPTAEFVEALRVERPATQPAPLPVPKPMATELGSRFFVWMQDPSVGALGRQLALVPTLVLNGPRNARIDTRLLGTTPVVRNADGDFLFPAETAEADCAHAFAIVQETLSLFERARDGAAIPWAWNMRGNADPITVFPRAGTTANAFYSRTQKALKFFSHMPGEKTDVVFTCRSPELVVHQTAHAMLDGLKPAWLGLYNPPQTGALHEAFADVVAILVTLSRADMASALIAMTKADLHAKRYLATLAEHPGVALGRPAGLRNADNDLKLNQVTNEVHLISQVFTGAMYDIIADMFKFERLHQSRTKEPVHLLLEVTEHMSKVFLAAITRAPNIGATYADVVNQMLKVSREWNAPRIYRTFIYDQFAIREVLAQDGPLAIARGEIEWENPDFTDRPDEAAELAPAQANHPSLLTRQDRSDCCGTMQLPEYAREPRRLDAELQRLCQDGQTIAEMELLTEEIEALKKVFQ